MLSVGSNNSFYPKYLPVGQFLYWASGSNKFSIEHFTFLSTFYILQQKSYQQKKSTTSLKKIYF